MSRKPDTPCSRCGTLLYSTARSAPADERLCRSCRRAASDDGGKQPPEVGEIDPGAGEHLTRSQAARVVCSVDSPQAVAKPRVVVYGGRIVDGPAIAGYSAFGDQEVDW